VAPVPDPLLLRKAFRRVAVIIPIYLPMALQPLWTLAVFSVFYVYTVGRAPWTRDQPVARPLPTHRTTQTQKIRTQTSMPQVGLEPTIPAFERAKTVHASDRAAIVIGCQYTHRLIYCRTRGQPTSEISYCIKRTQTTDTENIYLYTRPSSHNALKDQQHRGLQALSLLARLVLNH
jgi:hypothetical protein